MIPPLWKSRLAAKGVALVVLVLSCIADLTGLVRPGWQSIPLQGVLQENGMAYQARLADDRWSSQAKASDAVVLEDGRPLGPGNAQHDDIRRLGRGRFSFWGQYVYLSASDGSNLNTNGRRYEVYGPGPYTGGLRLLLYGLALLAFWKAAQALAGDPLALGLVRSHSIPIGRTAALIFAPAAAIVLSWSLVQNPATTLDAVVAWELRLGALGASLAAGWTLGTIRRWLEALDAILKATILSLASAFLVTRVESQMVPFPGFLPYAAIGVFAGIAFAFLRIKTPPIPQLSDRDVGLIALLAALCALPLALQPLARAWDNSGFMDSQSYDWYAHRIATGERPQGDSFTMPLFPYGMGLVYWTFGHFFSVQQVLNVALALLSVVLLVLTAWELFRDTRAVVFVAFMAAGTQQLRMFVHFTQVENWYIPIIAACLYAWSRYDSSPSLWRAGGIGLLAGLGLNCRLQGAFFFALLCLAPFVVHGLAWRRRVAHILIAITVSAASLLPWSVRNFIVEDRFSPSSDQATVALLFNDRRVASYGLRWDIAGWGPVLADYERRIPDPTERLQAIRRDARANTFGDLGWLSRAVFWRTLAFYGLLPSAFWASGGPQPTDWSVEWQGYLFWRFGAIALIAMGVLGLLRRPGPATGFLALGLLSNLAVLIFASQTEPRLSYSVFPLHILLAAAVFASIRTRDALSADERKPALTSAQAHRMRLIAACLGLTLLLGRLTLGRAYAHRPMIEPALLRSESAVALHRTRSAQYRDLKAVEITHPSGTPRPGEKVRVRLRLSNDMLPPKNVGRVPYLPDFATDPHRETYYYAWLDLQPPSAGIPTFNRHAVGITFFGATVEGDPREDDTVTIEGRVLDVKVVAGTSIAVWLHADAILK